MLKPKKKFGQNFLTDQEICNQIISLEKIKNENILEIGPGNFALTELIIKNKPKKFFAVEIDKEIFDIKKNDKIFEYLLNEDALKFDELEKFNNERFSIISNLPFNISSELLVKWCYFQNNYQCINSMTLMFQKELAERIVAKINTKKYGRISILSNAFFDIKKEIFVEKNKFKPSPKVDAIVLKFTSLKKNRIKKENLNKLENITSLFFNERRKKNMKKIQKLFNEKVIQDNNLQQYFELRAENIDKDTYYKMTEIN